MTARRPRRTAWRPRLTLRGVEWHREQLDPKRDEIDAFDWLGFTAAQD